MTIVDGPKEAVGAFVSCVNMNLAGIANGFNDQRFIRDYLGMTHEVMRPGSRDNDHPRGHNVAPIIQCVWTSIFYAHIRIWSKYFQAPHTLLWR